MRLRELGIFDAGTLAQEELHHLRRRFWISDDKIGNQIDVNREVEDEIEGVDFGPEGRFVGQKF